MFSGLRIGNFKAFAEAQRISFRPLTLIYGANSAGKSSLIHALLLARHGVDSGELDVHRTAIGGEAVDLGGFRQYVHRRDPTRRVEWTIELDAGKLAASVSKSDLLPSHKSGGTQIHTLRGRLAELLEPVRRVALSVQIGLSLGNQGQPAPGATPQVVLFSIEADGDVVIRMSRRPDGTLHLDQLEQRHPLLRNIVRAIVESSTTTDVLRESDFEGMDEAVNAIVPDIAAIAERLIPRGLTSTSFQSHEGQASLFPISRGNRRDDLATAVRFYLPRWLDDVLRGLSEAVSEELSHLRYLGPLRSYPPRHLTFAQHSDSNWFAGGGYAWDVVRRDTHVRALVNAWLTSKDRLQTPYELVLRELVGTDQLERPLLEGLERMSEEGLDLEVDVDYEPGETGPSGGRQYPIIKDPEAEAARLRDRIAASDIEKLSELILLDRRTNTPVSHRDVGIGISQVLPVLVSAYASERQVLAIEQPEIHLHPALQSDLGDVLLEAALGERQNQLIIETHSEHILLRVMRRMRETARAKAAGHLAVRPEDVCVLFIERVDKQSVVLEMRLDAEGKLLDPWPRGFFEEGFRERFAT